MYVTIITTTETKPHTKGGNDMTRLEMIREYVFDIASYTLEALDEIVKLINIDNNWSEEKYISFDVYKAETLRPGASAMGQPPGSDDGRLTTKERLNGG